MRLLLILAVLCGAILVSCDDGDDGGAGGSVSVGGTGGPRPADGGVIAGIGGVVGGGGRGGSAGASSDEDSGVDESEGVLVAVCRNVMPAPREGADPDPSMVYNGVATPLDFDVTRTISAWEEGCAAPTLRVTLSDGGCPPGNGHELTFFIPVDGGAEGSSLVIGQNVIREEPAPGYIRVRYTRPTRLSPNGTWGTCEGASGTLDVIGDIQLIRGRRLQANYSLDLTRCDEGRSSVQIIEGQLNVEIPASLSDICS